MESEIEKYGTCNPAIQARRAYQKKWREKNRFKVKKYQELYWKRKAEEMEAEKSARQD